MLGDESCRFPCWAGITPGVTTWSETRRIVDPVVDIVQVYDQIQCDFGICKILDWQARSDQSIYGYVYGYKDDLVYWVIVEINENEPAYAIDRVLTLYGQPERVLVSSTTFLIPESDQTLDIILAYPQNRFIIRYMLKADRLEGDIVACPQSVIGINFSIEPESIQWTDDYIKSAAYGGSDLSSTFILPLEEATQLTEIDFFRDLQNPTNNICIRTPIILWP